MAVSVFEFKDYKAFVNNALDEKSSKKRGARSELARAIQSQPGYVSRVLSGDTHFSLEQADLVNQFFGHSEDESQYFILLVEKSRAGSDHLRRHLDTQIGRYQNEYLNLKNRLKIKEQLDEKDGECEQFRRWKEMCQRTYTTLPSLVFRPLT